MILSMSNQFMVFLLTIIIGFITGFLYDVFRIIRKIFKHPNFLIQIEDIIYWFLVTIVMFRFIVNNNDGELRWFLILGLVLGMVIYFNTISRFIIKVLLSIIHIIEKIIRTAISILIFPFKMIFKIISIPAKFFKKKFKKTRRNANSKLKKIVSYVKIQTKGFFNNLKIILKKI